MTSDAKERLWELVSEQYSRDQFEAVFAEIAAPSPSASSVPPEMGLLRCLQFVESVYRLNFVPEGESSSTLKYMQDVIAANTSASSVLTDEQVKAARTEWFDEKWSECEFKDVDDYFNTRMRAAIGAALLQANGATS